MDTPEQMLFERINLWQPERQLEILEKNLIPNFSKSALLQKSKDISFEFYDKKPKRKNGEPSYIHPLNVVLNLNRVDIKDELTLSLGVLHDYVEDCIDEQIASGLKLNKELSLDKNNNQQEEKKLNTQNKIYEQEESQAYHILDQALELDTKILDETEKKKILIQKARIIEGVRLLSRKKKEGYYQYIANIFNSSDEDLKERVIMVKLADRIHNINCIEGFNEKQRLHECFKNLFILNNVKRFIFEKQKSGFLSLRFSSALQNLFTQCCKATFAAYLTLCDIAKSKGSRKVRLLIQLAFRKFAFEKGGLWEVTKPDPQEKHPLRLFQGVIRKYDAYLLKNYTDFEQREKDEREYCLKFFESCNLTEEEITAIIGYKDAYALKEIVVKLLYDEEYVMSGFLTTELSGEGKIQ
ncbi:hypothetical protein J4437_07655 [Candidatus Woesearchaeota archaeon]|nr:hypothetical protein [Candidatus Woesearchaeota archaeon]